MVNSLDLMKMFKDAVHKIVTTEEVDRIIKCEKGRRNKRRIQRFKEAYIACIENGGCAPAGWLLIQSIPTKSFFQDVFVYMLSDSVKEGE